ncbi:unnamed protein product [Symbiodinium sp. CCMP2592]|nr:unnamed protein product [Symbiodinium sp. CCMP2592]
MESMPSRPTPAFSSTAPELRQSDPAVRAPVPSGLSETGGPQVSAIAAGEASQAAADVQVEVRGSGHLPSAWRTWEEVTFPPRVRAPLVSAGFPAPTAIQQHSWPILTAGRDLIGVAKTGSGKTLAFLLPIFARLLESKVDLRGPPAALVLAPTRELACQIEAEAKRFGATAGMRAACLYGGAPKGPQLAELRQRPQLLVATPGRLNDLLEPPPGLSVAVDVKSVRYLVLDEADRMLDMGFEPQIRKIIGGLPQDRQTVMFTATWPLSIRRLAADFLRDAAEVRAGEVDELRVNPDITQQVVFCLDMREKEEWLDKILRESGNDQAIVFVNTKRMCEVVSSRTPNSMAIHGDKDQRERDLALGHFKSGTVRVLVATDVAARGLDIKAVKLVVNFDPPNREEDYVHRVGRTGRAGQKGLAWTLLTNEDGAAARSIADIFKRMELPVPAELSRRLASGELRSSGRARSRSVGRPLLRGGMGMDDDFDFGGDRFGSGREQNDFPRSSFMNDWTSWRLPYQEAAVRGYQQPISTREGAACPGKCPRDRNSCVEKWNQEALKGGLRGHEAPGRENEDWIPFGLADPAAAYSMPQVEPMCSEEMRPHGKTIHAVIMPLVAEDDIDDEVEEARQEAGKEGQDVDEEVNCSDKGDDGAAYDTFPCDQSSSDSSRASINANGKQSSPLLAIQKAQLSASFAPSAGNSLELDLHQQATNTVFYFFKRVNLSGVAYQEIYAGADMTICIFLLRAGAQIPAHDHPGMHVFGRLLFGRMRVRSYDFIDGGESGVGGSDEPRRAHYYGEEVLGPAPVTYGLGPEEGNIHQIEAVDDCAFFDILTPPYNPCGGRNCNYFEVSVDSHRSDSRSAGSGYFLKPVLRPEFGMAARHEQRP